MALVPTSSHSVQQCLLLWMSTIHCGTPTCTMGTVNAVRKGSFTFCICTIWNLCKSLGTLAVYLGSKNSMGSVLCMRICVPRNPWCNSQLLPATTSPPSQYFIGPESTRKRLTVRLALLLWKSLEQAARVVAETQKTIPHALIKQVQQCSTHGLCMLIAHNPELEQRVW